MTDTEQRIAERAIARRRRFLILSLLGVAIALALVAYYAGCRIHDPSYPLKSRGALVLLILLNARNNLRQYRFAGVIEKLVQTGGARP